MNKTEENKEEEETTKEYSNLKKETIQIEPLITVEKLIEFVIRKLESNKGTNGNSKGTSPGYNSAYGSAYPTYSSYYSAAASGNNVPPPPSSSSSNRYTNSSIYNSPYTSSFASPFGSLPKTTSILQQQLHKPSNVPSSLNSPPPPPPSQSGPPVIKSRKSELNSPTLSRIPPLSIFGTVNKPAESSKKGEAAAEQGEGRDDDMNQGELFDEDNSGSSESSDITEETSESSDFGMNDTESSGRNKSNDSESSNEDGMEIDAELKFKINQLKEIIQRKREQDKKKKEKRRNKVEIVEIEGNEEKKPINIPQKTESLPEYKKYSSSLPNSHGPDQFLSESKNTSKKLKNAENFEFKIDENKYKNKNKIQIRNGKGEEIKIQLFINNFKLSKKNTVLSEIQRIFYLSEEHTSGGFSEEQAKKKSENNSNRKKLPAEKMWEKKYNLKIKLQKIQKKNEKENSKKNTKKMLNIEENEIFNKIQENFDNEEKQEKNVKKILNLLKFLNYFIEKKKKENKIIEKEENEIEREFINNKLTNKLIEQLEDTITVTAIQFPPWIEELMKNYHFLFPFEWKKNYFICKNLGISRGILCLQENLIKYQKNSFGNAENDDNDAESFEYSHKRPGNEQTQENQTIHRIQRQRIRVTRDKILKSSLEVMKIYARSKCILEFEYFGEVGTGLGPTLEYFTLISHELQRKDLNLWTHQTSFKIQSENQFNKEKEYVFHEYGVYPAPLKETDAHYASVLDLFRFFGCFMAKAITDDRILDIPLSPPFFKWLKPSECFAFDDLQFVQPAVYSNLKKLAHIALSFQDFINARLPAAPGELTPDEENRFLFDGGRIEDLYLNFTLPTRSDWLLVDNGDSVNVTLWNLADYVHLVARHYLLLSVSPQMQAFLVGFNHVLPVSSLSSFSLLDLDLLICGFSHFSHEYWSFTGILSFFSPSPFPSSFLCPPLSLLSFLSLSLFFSLSIASLALPSLSFLPPFLPYLYLPFSPYSSPLYPSPYPSLSSKHSSTSLPSFLPFLFPLSPSFSPYSSLSSKHSSTPPFLLPSSSFYSILHLPSLPLPF